jgi:hypothetical protein
MRVIRTRTRRDRWQSRKTQKGTTTFRGRVGIIWVSFKEGDISTDKMMTKCRRITLVPFLCS